LVTLEAEFLKSPKPTATVRERISQHINTTERSVKLWFQNRYVCIKTQIHVITDFGRRAKIQRLAIKYDQIRALQEQVNVWCMNSEAVAKLYSQLRLEHLELVQKLKSVELKVLQHRKPSIR
jgi:hypothetical protein